MNELIIIINIVSKIDILFILGNGKRSSLYYSYNHETSIDL